MRLKSVTTANNTNEVKFTAIIPQKAPTSIGLVTRNTPTIKVFPTRVDEVLNIFIENAISEPLQLNIRNLKGISLLSQNVTTRNGLTELSINTSGYKSGMYFLSLSKKSKNITTVKFLKH